MNSNTGINAPAVQQAGCAMMGCGCSILIMVFLLAAVAGAAAACMV